MSMSPVQFAKDFARLKSDLAGQPSPDERLLLMVEFWPRLMHKSGQNTYRSYFDEYFSLLVPLATASNLTDLNLAELDRLQSTLAEIEQIGGEEFHVIRISVIQELATLKFYAGDVAAGLEVCAGVLGTETIDIPDEVINGKSEYESFAGAREYIGTKNPALYRFMQPIADEWESYRNAYYHDRIACLFVNKNNHGKPDRGRMRILEGMVEPFGKAAASDEVSFDNQVKTPDDPFVGATYDALMSVRRLFRSLDDRSRAETFFHAHYAIRNSGQTFTGDSVGLAAALVAYTCLLHPDIVRSERFLSAEIACTGGIGSSENIIEVNADSSLAKITRAFFAPMKYIVVPKANMPRAQEHVDRLREQYPRRRLQIIGVDHLREAIDNRNILRDERICIGEYVAKKAVRYSRAAKIQIPILAALLYALICVIYPEAWVFFDRNPHHTKMLGNGFEVFNADSALLWEKHFGCDTLDAAYYPVIYDLDGNNKNEVLFLPQTGGANICDVNARLYGYDFGGSLIFSHFIPMLGEYPGDVDSAYPYHCQEIITLGRPSGAILIAAALANNPARLHLRIFANDGSTLGWYINQGSVGGKSCVALLSNSDVAFLCYNNRVGRSAVFTLDPENAAGVSPPFHSKDIDLSTVRHGTQNCYILLPMTDVRSATYSRYSFPLNLVVQPNDTLCAKVGEIPDGKGKGRAEIWYYFDENMRVCKVIPDDEFKSLRDSLVGANILQPIPWPSYAQMLAEQVEYWVESEFVSEKQLRALESASRNSQSY